MIIYTPRYDTNDIMMVEEPTTACCNGNCTSRRLVRVREDPIDTLFRSMTSFEPFRPRRVERPVRRTIFDDFFGNVFSNDNIFDSMFPTFRRFNPDNYVDDSNENKENEEPSNGQVEEPA